MNRAIGLLLLAASLLGAQTYQANWESLDKRPTPAWFSDAKFGIFIHWGVYAVPGYAAAGVPKQQPYAEWYWHSLTTGKDGGDKPNEGSETWKFHQKNYGADFAYQDFAPMFKAELFDPDQWAQTLADSGAKYVVLTSKHHEGFALWPSAEASKTWGRAWNSMEVGPHRDLLGELSDAVRHKNVRMGFYYSLYEWYNPLWLSDKPRYVTEHMHPQFKDVVTRYKPSIIFSDGEWEMPSADWKSPELLAWLFNESSVKDEVVINDRWGKDTRHKHGGYFTTEYTAGMNASDHPWEESRGMAFSYGYNRMEDLRHYHTGRELVMMLVDLVSRGGNLLLDIGPTADGRIPVIMQERLEQIGSWLKVNGEAIYGTKPGKEPHQWSEGEREKVVYNQEFASAYDVSKLVDKPAAGKAAINAFFTTKGGDTFAILPRWTPGPFVIKGYDAARLKHVTLLGPGTEMKFKKSGDGVEVVLPDVPEELRGQPAWTLKLSR